MEALEAVIAVNKIFKAKNWVAKDIDELVFDSFCSLFQLLAADQRKLILELTENYHWITQAEYQDKFIQAIESANLEDLEGISTIYVFPIMKPEDEHKAKSGAHLLYMVKSYKQLMKKHRLIKFKILNTFDQLAQENFQLKEDERLYLVDDYIGSGQTFNYCIEEISKNPTLTPERIKIVCIAIQEETSSNLNSSGYGVLSSLTLRRGITDFNEIPAIGQKKQLMREIERHIPGSKSFSLGYDESEALVTMMRTPDNTFPVFWKRFRKDGKLLEAPFSRFEDM